MLKAADTENIVPPEALGTDCLLETVAGNSCVRELVSEYQLSELSSMSRKELRSHGVTPAAARRLACAFELGRRASKRSLEPGVLLATSGQIFDVYRERFRHEKKEHFVTLLVNGKNRLICEEMVSIGILTASLVHPREVFMSAIRHAAAGIILLHNHPSGDPEPSPEDHEVTTRLCAVGELVGIRVLDHLIVADGSYVSFLERGLISQ